MALPKSGTPHRTQPDTQWKCNAPARSSSGKTQTGTKPERTLSTSVTHGTSRFHYQPMLTSRLFFDEHSTCHIKTLKPDSH